jgi:hypothetical protein
MSYILEALRKMEKQKRRDSRTESWIDELSVETGEVEGGEKGPGRMLVMISILFGIAGIFAGLLFYHAGQIPDRDIAADIQSKAAGQEAKTTREAAKAVHAEPAPASKQRIPVEKDAPGPSRGVTLSDIKAGLDIKKGIEDKGTGLVLKVDTDPSPPQSTPDRPNRLNDLTDRYRLTSTGKANNRKYATIDRRDYRIGEGFEGLVITDIEKDRVYLRKKQGTQRYVIIFRYR